MEVSFEFNGINEIVLKLRQLSSSRDAQKAMEKGLRKAAGLYAKRAREILKGELKRKSISGAKRKRAKESIKKLDPSAWKPQRLKFERKHGTGNLLKGIKIKNIKNNFGGVSIVVAATAPHSHLFEYGTGPRKVKRPHWYPIDGKYTWITETGEMKPKPFMRPAFEQIDAEYVMNVTKDGVFTAVTRLVRMAA